MLCALFLIVVFLTTSVTKAVFAKAAADAAEAKAVAAEDAVKAAKSALNEFLAGCSSAELEMLGVQRPSSAT